MDMEIDDDVNEVIENKIVLEKAQNVVETPVNKVVNSNHLVKTNIKCNRCDNE